MIGNLSEEQVIMRDMVREFAAQNLFPNAARWEDEKMLDKSVLRELAALGLGAININSDVDGSELSRFDGVLIYEELSKGCISHAAFISIHNMASRMIDMFGNEELRQKYLPSLGKMEKFISYCLTEPDFGSDAASLKTKAIDCGDYYEITGTKTFISGAGFSDLYLLMARTGGDGANGISAFVIERDFEGISFGKNEAKMGWRAQPTAQVILDKCKVPKSNLLGNLGEGFKYAMSGLDGGRLNIAACALGGAQKAFDLACEYASQRSQFGRKIAEFQNTSFKLADMATSLEASRQLLWHAASSLDAKSRNATKLCAMAKRFVTDECFAIANQALQIHGGYGYLSEYQIERIVRDLRVHQILEGTNEIMRVIISRELTKGN